MQKSNIKELNKKILNLKTFYDVLVDNKGHFLPRFRSKTCTFSYLMKVVRDQKILKVSRNSITKPAVKQKKTVEDLVEIINNLLKTKSLSLGFEL